VVRAPLGGNGAHCKIETAQHAPEPEMVRVKFPAAVTRVQDDHLSTFGVEGSRLLGRACRLESILCGVADSDKAFNRH